ncbi:MAG TPA: TIM-barrel domain-containing protein [Polyangiaceae bacterium]|nr:TIM-barrel domain-containing protein [Polyangiaceae bacterium]
MFSKHRPLLAAGLWLCACAAGSRGRPVPEPAGAAPPRATPPLTLTTLAVPGGLLGFEVCAPDAIRVAFATEAKFFARSTLATAPKRCDEAPFELERSASEAILRTARLELRVELASGRVAFYDRSGALIAAEKQGGGRTLTPASVQGEATHHVRQEWEPNEGEALYGLGNHQLGLVNLKGYDLDLAQYNTNAIVPVLVSSRGYGILWDNTSFTRFGDTREWERVPGFAVDADGDLSIADSGSGDVTVEVTPPVTGDYLFQTFSSGDIRLSVAGNEVVRHFLQGWLPEADLARVPLTAGVKVPVRVQWTSDIGVKKLKLAWKTPPATPATTSLWSEVGDSVDYWFFYGPEIDRVIGGYRRVTGEAPMMPKWAFGLFQSRERYKTAAELSAVVAGFRKRKFPLDVIVQDWRYWVDGQWGSHEFDRERFPDPGAMIRELHAEHHVKFVISVWPKFYTNTANYSALRKAGFTYPEPKTPRLDFLRQPFIYYDAFAAGGRRLFWQQLRERLFDFGVDGWWLDATEPEVVEGPYDSHEHGRKLHAAAMHPTALGSGSRMLNAYSLVASQAIYEGQRATAPDQRVFILTRSAFAGQQRYASATWSGDITSTWTAFKKQIPGGLGFSISGVPYWTVDSGGFSVPARFSRGQNADEWAELNARWFEYATFLPLLRLHGQAPAREPWEFGGDASDAYRALQKFARLRYRLLPYVYSLAAGVTQRAGTILRPLVMDFRTDPAALAVTDQFMFGPSFLVSPITEYRATSRSVVLPATPGGWYDFWSGASAAGGQSVKVPAPLDAIPVHVRAGSIVPFGPELTYTGEKPADPIVLFVYAGSDGEFELYEDDGTSYAYEKGAFSVIPMRWNDATRTLTLAARRGSFSGMPGERTFHVVRVASGKAVAFSFTPSPDATATYSGRETQVALP